MPTATEEKAGDIIVIIVGIALCLTIIGIPIGVWMIAKTLTTPSNADK